MAKRRSIILLFVIIVAAIVTIGAISQSVREPAKHTSLAASKEEAKIYAVLDELYNEPNGLWNVTPEDGRLLRILAETKRAKHIVEIGTSNGYSALWFALALRMPGGKLITHEIDPYRVSLAQENFERAGVSDMVTIVEGNAHETVRDVNEVIDILFIDADKDGYLDYMNKLLSLVRPGGLIIAHNTMDREPEMKDFLKAITSNPDLETTIFHEQPYGMSVTLKKRK